MNEWIWKNVLACSALLVFAMPLILTYNILTCIIHRLKWIGMGNVTYSDRSVVLSFFSFIIFSFVG